MRNDAFLRQRLEFFLEGAFADVPTPNTIHISFGRKARRRFGSIKMKRDKSTSIITINGLFKEELIPLEIIDATIVHELCHYAHGFSSPLPKKYRHPHQGGVILKEFKARGLYTLYKFERQWTKLHWNKIVSVQFPVLQPRPRRSRRVVSRRASAVNPLLKLLADFLQP